jgi:hypothetical protein
VGKVAAEDREVYLFKRFVQILAFSQIIKQPIPDLFPLENVAFLVQIGKMKPVEGRHR